MSHNSIFYSLISISLSPSFPSHMIGSCCTHVHLYTTILQLYKSATITANYYLGLCTTTFSLLTIPIASNDVSKQKLNFLKWNGTHEPQVDALFSKPICHYSALQFNINNHLKRHSPTHTHSFKHRKQNSCLPFTITTFTREVSSSQSPSSSISQSPFLPHLTFSTSIKRLLTCPLPCTCRTSTSCRRPHGTRTAYLNVLCVPLSLAVAPMGQWKISSFLVLLCCFLRRHSAD